LAVKLIVTYHYTKLDMNILKAAIICFLCLDYSVLLAENLASVSRDGQTQSTPKELQAVIQKLMQNAKQAINRGNYELANSTIERAIRMQRSSPWLWHNLAVLRHQQEHYAKAIQLALKSNDLSAIYDPEIVKKLQLSNWKLIHHCHLQLGEAKKAKKALKYIKKLSF